MPSRCLTNSIYTGFVAAALTGAAAFALSPARAQNAPQPAVQQGGSPVANLGEGSAYTQIYRIPEQAQISAVMERVRNYMDVSTAGRLVDASGNEVTDFSQPIQGVAVPRGGGIVFNVIAYEQGVVYTGMLAAAKATGDEKYNDYVAKRMALMANWLKVAPSRGGAAATPPTPPDPTQRGRRGGRGGAMGALTNPGNLDACGAMDAATLKARLYGIGPDTTAITNVWNNYISNVVFRLPDGTIARHIPMPDTIWADDMYMAAPALALMGKTSGDKKYYDDAAKQIVQMSQRLFRPEKGIYAHGWITTNPDTVDIPWARANGWCALAMCEVLDQLPADHPQRAAILDYFRQHMRGLAARQSSDGLWHQILDRTDSYLETSASAMFVYALAHGINQGWISPAYGTQALIGWNAIAQKVNERGQVEGTCIGTNFDLSPMYYYYRPVSVTALHGYGPVLLAGAETLNLLKNDKINVALSVGSIYVSPKPGSPMPWMEDRAKTVTP